MKVGFTFWQFSAELNQIFSVIKAMIDPMFLVLVSLQVQEFWYGSFFVKFMGYFGPDKKVWGMPPHPTFLVLIWYLGVYSVNRRTSCVAGPIFRFLILVGGT